MTPPFFLFAATMVIAVWGGVFILLPDNRKIMGTLTAIPFAVALFLLAAFALTGVVAFSGA